MIYRVFIEKIVFAIYDFISHSSLVKYLKYLEKMDSLSAEELKEEQEKKLMKLLLHAKNNVPIYNNVVYKKNPYDFLKEFPIIKRTDLIENGAVRLADNQKEKGRIFDSSGSTGMKTAVFLSNKEYSYSQATQLHWLHWLGYEYGDRIIQVGLRSNRPISKRIKDFLLNTEYTFLTKISDEEKIALIKKNQKYKRIYLMGYPNVINELVNLSRENNLNLNVKGFLSFGENLNESVRKNIEDAYQCPILNTYGAAEGVMISAGLDRDKMYILSPNVYVEILDEDNNEVEKGTIGQVAVTNLNGYHMPIIRYKIGDKASLSNENEIGEMSYPLLNGMIGRDNDFIMTPEGRKFHMFSISGSENFIKYEVLQYQWHQINKNGVELLYIPKDGLELSEKMKLEYTEYIRKVLLSPKFAIDYIPVEEMKYYRSGKIQRVINDILEDAC